MKKKYHIWYGDDDIIHCIPPKSHRVTECGKISGIMFFKLTVAEIKILLLVKNRRLCSECWKNIKIAVEEK